MRERKVCYDLYTARGDRGVHYLSLLLLEGCRTGPVSSITWEPGRLSNGVDRLTITLTGYHVHLPGLLNDIPWGLPSAVMLVETIAPVNPGDYEIRTYRPKSALREVTDADA